MQLARLGWAAAVAILVLAAATASPAQPQFPALSGRVVDQANVLSAGTRAALTQLSEAHERATSNQVVVATVTSLQGYEIADYGVQMLRAWKLGQADRNNGVLLLVAPNDRQVRIAVGYGLEGALPDVLAFQIIQNEILPRFRANDTDGGVLAGARAVFGAIEGTYKAKKAAPLSPFVQRILDFLAQNFVIILIVVVWVLGSMYERYRRWREGPNYVPPARRYGRYRRSSNDYFGGGSFGGGFGGGGSSGGGGGGFSGGGGSSGGGGASGRW